MLHPEGDGERGGQVVGRGKLLGNDDRILDTIKLVDLVTLVAIVRGQFRGPLLAGVGAGQEIVGACISIYTEEGGRKGGTETARSREGVVIIRYLIYLNT